jgi:phosphatidylglycerol---prolipoprotein diacylglyceryl transferase
MMPFLRLGPFLLQLPGLAVLAGVWLGSALTEKQASRLRLSSQDVYNLVFYGLLAGLVGARLAYAAQYAAAFQANPLGLFALTPATLSPLPGAAVGLVVAVLFGRRRRLPLRPTLDALAPGVAMFLAGLAVAHLFSGNAFGMPARLPWSIYLWNDYRHPTQVYEIVAAVLIVGLAWRQPLGAPGRGLNFVLVVALSAAARIFLEGLRGDSVFVGGSFRAAQLVGLLVLGVCLWLMGRWSAPPADTRA